MADGTNNPVGQIELGDEVLATDPETGQTHPGTVEKAGCTKTTSTSPGDSFNPALDRGTALSDEDKLTEIELGSRPRWRRIFNGDTRGAEVHGACPVCGSTTLHRWYSIEQAVSSTRGSKVYIGRGRLWEWCSACRSFEYYPDGYVSDWWSARYSVEPAALRYDPGPVERERAVNATAPSPRATQMPSAQPRLFLVPSTNHRMRVKQVIARPLERAPRHRRSVCNRPDSNDTVSSRTLRVAMYVSLMAGAELS